MRFVALALVATFALAGCADDASTTSEFVMTSSPTSASTPPKTSSALPAPSELKTEAMPALKSAAFGNDSFASGTAANEVPDWMKNCSAGMPCVPPEEAGPESNGGEPSSVPDWMQDCSAGMPCVPPEEAGQESAEESSSDVPEWMKDCQAGLPCDFVRGIKD